jgi:hypothetical protein
MAGKPAARAIITRRFSNVKRVRRTGAGRAVVLEFRASDSLAILVADCRLMIDDCRLLIADFRLAAIENRQSVGSPIEDRRSAIENQSTIGNRQSSIDYSPYFLKRR